MNASIKSVTDSTYSAATAPEPEGDAPPSVESKVLTLAIHQGVQAGQIKLEDGVFTLARDASPRFLANLGAAALGVVAPRPDPKPFKIFPKDAVKSAVNQFG